MYHGCRWGFVRCRWSCPVWPSEYNSKFYKVAYTTQPKTTIQYCKVPNPMSWSLIGLSFIHHSAPFAWGLRQKNKCLWLEFVIQITCYQITRDVRSFTHSVLFFQVFRIYQNTPNSFLRNLVEATFTYSPRWLTNQSVPVLSVVYFVRIRLIDQCLLSDQSEI